VIVVADASPINYLLLTGYIEVVPKLFERVAFPLAVHRELLHSGSPQLVRAWASQLPSWCEVIVKEEKPDPELIKLDAGERAAIQLAAELEADFLLIDERAGRRAAIAKGLPVIGVLGLLDRADRRGLLDLRDALRKLDRTNFRIAPQLKAAYLRRP